MRFREANLASIFLCYRGRGEPEPPRGSFFALKMEPEFSIAVFGVNYPIVFAK